MCVNHLIIAIRDVSCNMMMYITCSEMIVERQLPSTCLYLTSILDRRPITKQSGNRKINQNILSSVIEHIECQPQLILQQTYLNAHIEHTGGLPFNIGIG